MALWKQLNRRTLGIHREPTSSWPFSGTPSEISTSIQIQSTVRAIHCAGTSVGTPTRADVGRLRVILSSAEVEALLEPFVQAGKDLGGLTLEHPGVMTLQHEASRLELFSRLAIYLELIVRWNARMNLTAIREPEEIVRRHFGESLLLGCFMQPVKSVLDLGSGAGFSGPAPAAAHA